MLAESYQIGEGYFGGDKIDVGEQIKYFSRIIKSYFKVMLHLLINPIK